MPPRTMLAVECDGTGAPDVLRAFERPVPSPGEGEVLIRVAAAGLNGADLTQRRGGSALGASLPKILGLEVSGEIVEVGRGVAATALGQPVCALLFGGGYAEYVAVQYAHCLPLPSTVGLVEAAALPEALVTVWLNVIELGRLQADDIFLVHGGSSGIGTFAIQVARALGADVFATAGTWHKCEACEKLGAQALNYKVEDFVSGLRRLRGDRGVDVVLDMVGGDYLARNVEAMARGGRMVMIAFKNGSRVDFDFRPVQQKQLSITGSLLRGRSNDEKARLVAEVHRTIWPLIEARQITPVIDTTFPLAEAASAHARMERGDHIGKILLTI